MTLSLLLFLLILTPGSGCTGAGSWLPVRRPKPTCINSIQQLASISQWLRGAHTRVWSALGGRTLRKSPLSVLQVGLGQVGREFWSSDYLAHILEEGWAHSLGLMDSLPHVKRYRSRRTRVEPQQVHSCQSPRTVLLNGHFRRQLRCLATSWKYL